MSLKGCGPSGLHAVRVRQEERISVQVRCVMCIGDFLRFKIRELQLFSCCVLGLGRGCRVEAYQVLYEKPTLLLKNHFRPLCRTSVLRSKTL